MTMLEPGLRLSRKFLTILRDQVLSDYFRKWVLLGVLIGVVAGLGAIVFFVAIDKATWLFLGQAAGYLPPSPRGEGETLVREAGRSWLFPLVAMAGGLISGLIVFSLAPEAEGHGTDAAIEAFHQKGGRIRAHIPFVKLVASAVTIGSGGSAGREGPTAQIAAGFGSWLGDVFQLSPSDRRIALAVGVGSGIGSIFKAPLGGAILSAEILYVRDFELEALVPGFIASVIGYSIFGAWSGWDPVFGSGLGLRFNNPVALPSYTLLGILCGLTGIGYVKAFYGTRDLFHRLRLPPHVKPAIGGLAVGIIALLFPEVLSMGYGWLQLAIEGNTAQLAVSTMLALVVLKIVATSLTIGSGGSGGVFAPGLFIGGMVGGGLWGVLHGHVPGMPSTPAPFVIVGMMALFGGVAKAPIAVILMVAEMTNEFSMIIPAMLATTVAYLITGNTRIYESQLPTRADSPAHRSEYVIPLIQTVTVADAMRTDTSTLAPDDLINEGEKRLSQVNRRGLPVVKDGRLVGIFTGTDALRAQREGLTTVGEAMSTALQVAYPADSLHTALRRMTSARISRLPVVERDDPNQLLGMLNTADIAAALDSQLAHVAALPGGRGGGAQDPLAAATVAEIMSRDFLPVNGQTPAREVAQQLIVSDQHAALVVDDGGSLTGIVTLQDLRNRGNQDDAVEAIASRNPITARPSYSAAEALAQPGAGSVRQIPVVDVHDGKLVPVGVLRRVDVIDAYLRARDRQAFFTRGSDGGSESRTDEIVTVERMITRSNAIAGLSLAELNLPQQAIVISLVRKGRRIIPRGMVKLQPGDRLQIMTASSEMAAVLERLSTQARRHQPLSSDRRPVADSQEVGSETV